MSKEISKELLRFIDGSPSRYHVVENMRKELEAAGYTRLFEESPWNICMGGRYYVTRNGSALIAFSIPKSQVDGFQMMASHSDSPAFKLKEHAEMEADHHFVKLNVEKYGGMLMAPWFDRPLSLAGRLLIQEGDEICSRLVDVDRDLLLIPSLAMHMNRKANDGYSYNPQVDLLPLFGGGSSKGCLMEILAEACGSRSENILGMDVFLYNRMAGSIWGAKEEFISGGRLDDLQCAWCSMKALLASRPGSHISVHCVLDNEEVGSMTRQGAASTFLKDTLERIGEKLGWSREEYLCKLASSFLLSVDNAHSVHPNYTEKSDAGSRPYLNGGVVLKHSANQKYTTDGVTAAVFRQICRIAKVPCQDFTNRSDMEGGSTLGNISGSQVAVPTADIGLAQLAMHSPYETAGILDTEYLIRAATTFFTVDIRMEAEKIRIKKRED